METKLDMLFEIANSVEIAIILEGQNSSFILIFFGLLVPQLTFGIPKKGIQLAVKLFLPKDQ